MYAMRESIEGTVERKQTREVDAFDLGWDHGLYSIVPPANLPSAVREGYDAAAARCAAAKADDYVRKWLLLRTNAMARGIAFDPGVTPEYLRSIDVGMCSVSGVELTRATGSLSDWSIDRVLNDRGYVRYNLMVVSTRVNKAKGAWLPSRIRDIAGWGVPFDGLLSEEWRRLASIVTCFEQAEVGVSPVGVPRLYGTEPCPGVRLGPLATWQYLMGLAVHNPDSALLPRLLARFPDTKHSRRSVRQFLQALVGRSRKEPSPVRIWDSGRLQKRLDAACGFLPQDRPVLEQEEASAIQAELLGIEDDRVRLRGRKVTCDAGYARREMA